MKRSDLDDFVNCYHADDITQRQETYNAESNPNGRWRKFSATDFLAKDKIGMDITWIQAKTEENDMSLAELLDTIGEKAEKINVAVKNLQALLANIEE